jgi:hypothetical protein
MNTDPSCRARRPSDQVSTKPGELHLRRTSVVVSAGQWDWGWDALVAVGTLALALGTSALAISTFLMARTAGKEVRAKWRPVIVPAADVEVDWIEDDELVVLAIRNIGEGGAFDVDAGLELGDSIVPASAFAHGETEPLNFAALPPKESLTLHFTHIDEKPASAAVVIDYSDLTGHRYGSRIEVREATAYLPTQQFNVLRMARVRHARVRSWSIGTTHGTTSGTASTACASSSAASRATRTTGVEATASARPERLIAPCFSPNSGSERTDAAAGAAVVGRARRRRRVRSVRAPADAR